MKQKLSLQGKGIEELQSEILNLDLKNWDIKSPLPPTRQLAQDFDVSPSAAYRLLQKLVSEGKLVAHEINGRFYLKEGEAFATRNLPIACLYKNMENWFFVARDQLIGITKECERLGRGTLLYRHEHLVHHPSMDYPPQFGEVKEQIKSLELFFKNQKDNYSAVILDDLWKDEALAPFQEELSRAVIVGRETKIKALKSLSIDFRMAAFKILAHLHGRGFKRVVIAIPFIGNEAIDQQVASIQEAAESLGLPIAKEDLFSASTPPERRALVEGLKKAKERVAIFCPEDNVATLIYKEIQLQGLECPGKIGLLSGMGESGVKALKISSIMCDYVEMGRRSVIKLFDKSSIKEEKAMPEFFQGVTT
ncbi:MAG: substrate-binding domain-containing protein [Verrucomicrobiota bacterium]